MVVGFVEKLRGEIVGICCGVVPSKDFSEVITIAVTEQGQVKQKSKASRYQ